MPSKHIDDVMWRKVEKETVRAVILTKSAIKDTEVLKMLIQIGLDNVTDEDYENLAKKKK